MIFTKFTVAKFGLDPIRIFEITSCKTVASVFGLPRVVQVDLALYCPQVIDVWTVYIYRCAAGVQLGGFESRR